MSMGYTEQRFSSPDRARAESWVTECVGAAEVGRGLRWLLDYRVGDSRMLLSTAYVTGVLQLDVHPRSLAVMSADAPIQWRSARRSGVVAGGPILLRPHRTTSVRVRDAAVRTLILDPAALEHLARLVYVQPDLVVRFHGAEATSAESAEFWRMSLDLAMQHVAVGALEDDLVRTSILRAMTIATLESFSLVGDRVRMRSSAVRRLGVYESAVRFLNDFAALPISTDDTADASRSSVPELVDAFLTYDDGQRTPSEYLTWVRLTAAREDLVAADPESAERIDAIALRWGFGSEKLFVRRYQREFGETPRDTLWG